MPRLARSVGAGEYKVEKEETMAMLHAKLQSENHVAESKPQEMDEERLWIEAAAQGDVAAFRLLYDQHFDFVTRQVTRVMGPGGELEDVVQEVFVQVFRSLQNYRHESKFTTWLYRVAYNVTISHIRRTPRTVELADWRALREPISTWNALEARDMCRVLYSALEQVSEEQREAFLLFEVEGLKLREISEFTGESINTVAARVRRTRERLQAVLEQAGGEHD